MNLRLVVKVICVLSFGVFLSAADCREDGDYTSVNVGIGGFVPTFLSGGGYTHVVDEGYYDSGYYQTNDCGCYDDGGYYYDGGGYYEDDWRAKRPGRRK